jgi:hypothetical protein
MALTIAARLRVTEERAPDPGVEVEPEVEEFVPMAVALNVSKGLAALAFMAKTIPDWQWLIQDM